MKAAIIMVARGDDEKLRVTDGQGREHLIESAEHLRETVDSILDDPDLPAPEQVARLEQAAEQIITHAAASFLPEIARPLAAPLVRDVATLIRRRTEAAETRKAERPATPPTNKKQDNARSARITRSRIRLGGGVKRRGSAA